MRAGAGDSFSLDKRCSRRDGSFIWVTATLSGVRGENGGIEYIVAIIEGATERKLAKERQRTLPRLPFSATSGRSVTHVAGIVVYDGHTKPVDLNT